MNSVDGLFMSISEAVITGPTGKSFEEVRMEDYIKAYQLKGRPPSPVAQEPVDEYTRKVLGLSPLFKPHMVSGLSNAAALTPAPTLVLSPLKAGRVMDPTKLPLAQEFVLPTAAGEKYYSMSCMTQFENFSHEELRYYAYFSGHKQPPTPVKMDPFVQPTKEPIVSAAPGEEKLESISARPGYEKHSPEEHRIAFLLYSREMTSAELFQIQNPSAAPISVLAPPPVAPTINTSFSSLASALPQPVYASTTPSVPKFTFGFK